ncbi:MAG: aspartate carbamoyltransferase [Candidatus Thermoplasmatota archaeon]|jgi:aspartate carbamoyltransferase catalytic subunit|nr:aspartate carbamoyltransferase [Candidatus Thermoplasmatota archaeon]
MIKSRCIVSIDDVSDSEMNEIFDLTDRMNESLESGKPITTMKGKILATLFYEPSTRTRLSFESAMQRLGGSTLGFSDVKSSSVSKGETLADTVRMAESYSDIIVIRHPLEGSARLASRFTAKPVINAGDGSGQHPTQTLLDLYTMKKEFGKIDGLKIALIGDLKYGRTVHSLLLALSRFKVQVTLVSPPSLRIPQHIISKVKDIIKIEETDVISHVLPEADVFYATRIQKERFTDQNEYQSLIGSYSIDSELVSQMKETAIIMHPLPRVDEINPSVDALPQARYFKQAYYGVPLRMALITLLLGGEN